MHFDADRVEIRASEDGPKLHAVILTEGRAARGIGRSCRAEIVAVGATHWPDDGIPVRTRHHGPAECRAVPERAADGRITITCPATPAIVTAVREGRDRASMEFIPEAEFRTAAGIRELERIMLTGAALSTTPEYHQTSAEVRDSTRGRLPRRR